MKYKLYEKIRDILHTRLFSKTNIAIVAVLSIALNVAMAGVAYNEHKELELMSAVYASQSEVTETYAAAEETTAYIEVTTTSAPEIEETQPQTETGTTIEDETQAENQTQESQTQENEQSATYYVTDSGTKYHISGCSYLKKSRNAISLSDARAKGYTPCSRCIG